jgi:hypothetical protein
VNRRHYLGVSMARKVDRVRPRSERDIPTDEFEVITRRQAMRALERAQPDNPPRRLNGAGFVVIVCAVVVAVFYALGFIAARFWGHQ